MNIEALRSEARQYAVIKDHISELTGRQAQLKTNMMSQLEELEPDDTGHRVVQFDDDVLGSVRITKQRRVSKSLNTDIAEDILTAKGLRNTCIKMVPILDEEAILSAFYEGRLTEADIDAMFPAKTSYAFLFDTK